MIRDTSAKKYTNDYQWAFFDDEWVLSSGVLEFCVRAFGYLSIEVDAEMRG
ncbi:MAG: hypothetical protein AAF242_15355 [Bacteroidota bacterium]